MSMTTPTFTVRPGIEVRVDDRFGVVTHILDLDSVLVRDTGTGQIARRRLDELKPSQTEIAARAEVEIEQVDGADWDIAQQRLDIIRSLLGRRRTRAEVAARAKEFGFNASTLYTWISIYEEAGRLTALIPRTRSDKGSVRLAPEVEAVISATIEDVYLTGQRKSITKVVEAVRERCLNAQLEAPHPNTVRNRIGAMSESFTMRKRHGAKAADQIFAPVEGRFPGADWPLAFVQIDHTKLDIILVDDVQRRPIGRPWITLAIDVYSRMVAGFYVSFDPPGAMATGLCLAHAILPKEQWLTKHGIDDEWPLWGMPKSLHLDNAREFRGNMLQRACAQYGIDIAWRPVARPNFGGHIERLLGTVLREIHTLPGTTFSNPRARGNYDSDGKATLTLGEFETWLATFIVQVYHRRRHDAIGMAPVDKYKAGILGDGRHPGIGLPPRPRDADRLRLDFMPFLERTVQDYGVVIDEVHYYHDVLRRWIGAKDPKAPGKRRKFIFRRDPRDISVVWFYDPEVGTHYPIPYRDTSHAAISVWELREAHKAAEDAGKVVDERAIFSAYERMRAIEETAKTKTRAIRRAQQRRSDAAKAPRPAAPAPFVTASVDDSPAPPPAPFDDLDDFSDDHDD
jgi:putative transposase